MLRDAGEMSLPCSNINGAVWLNFSAIFLFPSSNTAIVRGSGKTFFLYIYKSEVFSYWLLQKQELWCRFREEQPGISASAGGVWKTMLPPSHRRYENSCFLFYYIVCCYFFLCYCCLQLLLFAVINYCWSLLLLFVITVVSCYCCLLLLVFAVCCFVVRCFVICCYCC